MIVKKNAEQLAMPVLNVCLHNVYVVTELLIGQNFKFFRQIYTLQMELPLL